MENYLISEAIGDIAGSAYEGRAHRIKDYDKVKLFSSRAHFTDDTMLTYPDWTNQKYADFYDSYIFNSICASPMAYAYYKKMPDALVYQAMKKLPDWMVDVSERFDTYVRVK